MFLWRPSCTALLLHQIGSLLFLSLAFVSLRFSEWRARVQMIAPGLSLSAAGRCLLLSGLAQLVQALTCRLVRTRADD